MKISIAKIPAPDINPEALWSMSDVAFNKWRRENDYPRILSYFKREFSRFNEWQSSQNLTDDEIYEFGIGRFLRPEPAMYVYRHKAGVSPSTMFVPDDLDLSLRPLIVSKKKIIPYLTWARELKINVHPEVRDYRL